MSDVLNSTTSSQLNTARRMKWASMEPDFSLRWKQRPGCRLIVSWRENFKRFVMFPIESEGKL